jgi:hypothetical protein
MEWSGDGVVYDGDDGDDYLLLLLLLLLIRFKKKIEEIRKR